MSTPGRPARRSPTRHRSLWRVSGVFRSYPNCIIFYNAMLLSRLLAHKEATGDAAGAALITHVSPVAWQHINFYGRYEFTKGPGPIDVDALVETLAQHPLVSMEEE